MTRTGDPPAVPRRVLECFVPENAALAGDLCEEYRHGRSAWWYWRQALTASAIHIASTVSAHPLLTVRATAVGWTVLWLFSFVAVDINRFMSGWVLDRLILLFWTHPFPMMWATQLSYRPAQALAFLISGWTVGRLHRCQRPAMVVAFTTTVVLQTAYDEIHSALTRNTSAPYLLLDLLLLPLPLLILLGGLWGSRVHRSLDVSRPL